MSKNQHSRYVKRVRILRYLLPCLLTFVLCLVFFWPQISFYWKAPLVKSAKEKLILPEITDNRLMTPEYSSVDDEGRPYMIGADWAIQQEGYSMELESPKGSITMGNNETFSLKAKDGLYNHGEKTLHLEGDVTLTSDQGQSLVTEDVMVDLESKDISSNTPVSGNSFAGKLKAQKGFETSTADGKKRLVLKGKSSVTINPGLLKKDKIR